MLAVLGNMIYQSPVLKNIGEEEKDFGAEETEGFGAMQSSEPWSR